MKQAEYNNWMQNIVCSVDALETSYKRRLADMAAEYQLDVEDMLRSYKEEKKLLLQELDDLRQALGDANQQLHDAQRMYKTESVQHKITKDCLLSTRHELTIMQKNDWINDDPIITDAPTVET